MTFQQPQPRPDIRRDILNTPAPRFVGSGVGIGVSTGVARRVGAGLLSLSLVAGHLHLHT